MTALIDYKGKSGITCDRKTCCMLPVTSNDFKEYLVWLLAFAVVAFGFRHAKGVVAFVLDKLYQLFIQNNTGQA
jgi:hypothetical protein